MFAVVLGKRTAIQDPLPQAEVVSSIVDQMNPIDRFRGMGPGLRQDDSGVRCCKDRRFHGAVSVANP